MNDLKGCPFCGGEVEERGGTCNYEKGHDARCKMPEVRNDI